VSYVNHIPAELLGMYHTQAPNPNPTQPKSTIRTKQRLTYDHHKVGPIAPLQHTPSLTPRYTLAMFQESRPQLLNKTVLTSLVEKVQYEPSDTRLADLKKSLEVPLPPMDRKKGQDVDFFFQALLTGTTVVVVPVLVGLGVMARYALPYVQQRL